MFNKTKYKLGERQAKKQHDLLHNLLADRHLDYKVHDLEREHYDHTHHLIITEIINPPNEYNTFINIQAHWTGKHLCLTLMRADRFHDIEVGEPELVSFARVYRPKLEGTIMQVLDHISVEWLTFESGITSD